jgi:uncharacterized protein with PIN domain
MSVDIKLESGAKGYKIVRKKCPNCNADFVFRLAENEVYDVLGEAYNYPEEKVVRCKVCMSTFKYEVKPLPRIPHVGGG